MIRPFDDLNRTTLPFELVGNVVVVRAHAADQSLDVILDTGASHSVLTPEAAERLGLVVAGSHPAFPEATAIGAGGEMTIKFARIPHLQLGTLVLDDVDVAVMEMGHLNERIAALFNRQVDGALGFNVLRNYRVTFDFPAYRIEIEPSAAG